MNHIKILKSDKEHEQALARLLVLMDDNPPEGSVNADELEVLSVLIQQYEDMQFPIELPDPIEAIKFRMEQQGLRNKDLVKYIGSAPKVSEVLSGKRQLSLNMIRKLCDGLGLSAEVLIRNSIQKKALCKQAVA